MNTDEVISAIKRFESNEADFETTQKALEALTGKIVDRDHLGNYWRSESIEEFAEVLATPPLGNWQEIDDVRAVELIREALIVPGGAIFLRNEALEKRFGKSEGFLIDLVFHEDIGDLILMLWASGFCFSLNATDELDPNKYRSIHWSYFDGKKYASGISDEVFEKMTEWNFESKIAPPISPQRAYKIAKERLDKIKMRKGLGWELEQVGLTPVGNQEKRKWIWKVSFELVATDGENMMGAPVPMAFFVTMDGDLIAPVVSVHKR